MFSDRTEIQQDNDLPQNKHTLLKMFKKVRLQLRKFRFHLKVKKKQRSCTINCTKFSQQATANKPVT